MKPFILTIGLALFSLPLAAADDLDAIAGLGQSQFSDLSDDLGAALSYKGVIPAEPLGITGFDVGVEVTQTRLANSEAFDLACSGCDVDTLYMPKIHLHKGLPFNIDVGYLYASVPGSNIELSGYELRWAFLEGSIATPAMALRIAKTDLGGVDELDFSTLSYDVSISKGFAMVTPYAGIGQVMVDSSPSGDAKTAGLKSEEPTLGKVFVGANVNFGLLNLAVEGDNTGDAQSMTIKLGFRF